MVHMTYMDPAWITEQVLARFWAKTQRQPSGCIVWTASLSQLGYGRFKINGQLVSPHRLIFVIETGRPMPEGLIVDHLCRNPACLNIAHLELVTYAENTARGISTVAPALRVRLDRNECMAGHSLDETGRVYSGGVTKCFLCVKESNRLRKVELNRDPAFAAKNRERMRLHRLRLKATK